jgi:hypothetical protein
MFGSDTPRGYCLEVICTDFLPGVSLESGNQDALLPCLTRLIIELPKPHRKQLLRLTGKLASLANSPSILHCQNRLGSQR